MQMSSSSTAAGAGAGGSVAPSDPDTTNHNWPGCFRHVARCRRLNKEEVVLILSNPLKFGLVRTEVLPPEGITSGTVYLCSKDRVRVLKHDGIDYVKRNAAQGSNRIREDVVKMKVNGRHAVNSYSSRGSGSACFWRRRYALEPPAPANGASGSRGRGQQNVAWGDQLVHYLDDEEARGFARRSPFGAAGVARPLTSEECWRGRGAQLPPDGKLFLAPSRRETRRDEPLPLPSPAADKVLPSLPASVKQEQAALRAGSGPANGSGSNSTHTNGGGWSGTVKAQGARRYTAQTDVRAIVTGVWSSADIYAMNSNGNVGEGALVSIASSGSRLGGVAGAGSTSGGAPVWDPKKGADAQQSSDLNNPTGSTGLYDDLGGLEFEGLGMNDVNGGGNASADDDMSDLFRSFLVDGDDMLATSGGSGGHSGSSGMSHSSGSQTGGATVEVAQPSGFGLRVGSGSAGVRVATGQDGDAVGPSLIRRRANTSPELEDTGTGGGGGLGSSQRSSIVMLPTLVGSPPRRPETLPCGNNSSNMQTNDENEANTMENDATPRNFVPSHGRTGSTASGATVAEVAAAATASSTTVANNEACSPPTSLQLGSSWSDTYAMSSSKATASSSSPGVPEVGGTVVHAAPSPAGPVSGLSGSGPSVTIVDFSPTWDFAPGGAKLLICLAAPIDADPGSVGPIIFFADRPVQSEVVSQTVLRCKVPPGPGLEGTGRVPIRIEAGHGVGRLDQVGSTGGDRLGGIRNAGGVTGVHLFEYRSPANSPSSTTSALSRGGTPRVSTPAKRLAWQETEDGKMSTSTTPTMTSTTTATRKREWGEVVTSSAPPPPLEAVYSSPVSCNWMDRGRVWGTPRACESSPWGMRGVGRSSSSASNGRRGQPQMWRRASGDFGATGSVESAGQTEDGLGYPLAACDGRECKIRIVERLGEISDSRAHSAGAQRMHGGGSGGAGGCRALTVASPSHSAAGGGSGAQESWGEPGACGSTDVHQSTLSASTGGIGNMCSSMSCVSMSMETGEGAKSLVVGGSGVGRGVGAGGIVAARGGNDLGQHQALDDTALNELGDAELEVLLEQMWMKVMGQLTDLESELNALDARGFSVLHYTCLHSLSELVPVLLERGADVNLRTGDGRDQTPLHLAAIGGNLRIVQELMRRGANMNAVDGLGLTPDKLAMRCNKREVGLFLWGQTRGTGVRGGGGGQSAAITNGSANGSNGSIGHASSGTAPTRTPTPSSTPQVRQGSPTPLPPWGGGVSPAECPPPLWCDSASGSGAENWQGQLSPSPETPNERLSIRGGTPTPSALGGLGDGGSLSDGGNPASPAAAPAPGVPGTTPASAAGLDGSSGGSAVVAESGTFMGQVNVSWIGSTPRTSGNNTGRALEGKDIMGGDVGAGGVEGGGPWGLGLPPPGGTDKVAAVGVRAAVTASPATERSDLVSTIDEGGSVDSDDAGGEPESELDNAKKSSMEQFLAEAFSTLSLHEKCALHLHVTSLQQQEQQQQREQQQKEGQAITGGEKNGDTRGRGAGSKGCFGVDFSKLSSVSSMLSNDDGGLRATDMQTIIEMMGPQDLSELEDEVKVIQNNVRAWILRCNYKSLRKAARTLQTAWRERQKSRVAEAPGAGIGTGGPPASPLSISGNHSRSSNSLALGSGSEPMDDGCGGSSGDLSGAETPPLGDGGGSGFASDGASGTISNSSAAAGVVAGRVSLNLGLEEEMSRREDRAANALQTAARVMLERRGRFQRLARETSALLVIQKRSREWLRQKQNNW